MRTEKNRRIDLDIMRILACFGVILNHTISVYDKSIVEKSTTTILNSIFFFLCKTSVPLFLIISGILLLQREESIKSWITKRVFRMVFILVVWSILYRGIYNFAWGGGMLNLLDIQNCLKDVFFIKPVSRHFWYLYVLISFYFCLPFFRQMIKEMDNKKYMVFLLLWLAIGCFVPQWNKMMVNNPITLESHFTFPIFTGLFGYCLIAPYIDKISVNIRSVILSAIMVFGCIAFNIFVTLRMEAPRLFDEPGLLSIAILSISYFIIIKGISVLKIFKNQKVRVIISHVSKTTFGVYLMHIIVIFLIQKYIENDWIKNKFSNSILETILFDLLIFIVCSLLTSILMKIPMIRKIVT